MNSKYFLGQIACVLIFAILPMSLLWWQYVASGDTIIQVPGSITDIDTTSLDDCNLFDKTKHQITVHYNYTFEHEPYSNHYDICETNDGAETYLKLHPIGSPIKLYLQPDDPNGPSVTFRGLMNQYLLAFAITFSLISCLLLSFLTCCFETITTEMKNFLSDQAKDAAGNAIKSIV